MLAPTPSEYHRAAHMFDWSSNCSTGGDMLRLTSLADALNERCLELPISNIADVVAQMAIAAGIVDHLTDGIEPDDPHVRYSDVINLRRILRSVLPFLVTLDDDLTLGATRAEAFLRYCDRMVADGRMPA